MKAENEPRHSGVISLRGALFAYALLAIAAALTLSGKLLYLALIILAGFTVKTWLHSLREKLNGNRDKFTLQ